MAHSNRLLEFLFDRMIRKIRVGTLTSNRRTDKLGRLIADICALGKRRDVQEGPFGLFENKISGS